MEKPISNPLKALDVMIEAEKTVAKFYRVCSERFPQNSDFWGSLAREELAHAQVITRLVELVNIQPEQFTSGASVPLETISSFISRMEASIKTLEESELPEEKALLIAYQIENTFIELKYVEVVNTENKQYKALLDQVIADTLKHKEKVVGRIGKLKEESKPRKMPS
jgi:ferritin